MSEKKSVPTFRVLLTGANDPLEGAIVAPDKRSVATDLTELHEILVKHEAILLYSKQWMYVPRAAIHHVLRGGQRFPIPWPLISGEDDPSSM